MTEVWQGWQNCNVGWTIPFYLLKIKKCNRHFEIWHIDCKGSEHFSFCLTLEFTLLKLVLVRIQFLLGFFGTFHLKKIPPILFIMYKFGSKVLWCKPYKSYSLYFIFSNKNCCSSMRSWTGGEAYWNDTW